MNPLLEPAYIPPWFGRDPIRYWIAPEMRQFEHEIRLALGMCQRPGAALRLRFEETTAPGQLRCIEFRMEPLFGVVALGFYPPPLNAEPISGNVILNAQVPWNGVDCRPLVLPALMHELTAHSIGLGHLYLPESVRFPVIRAGVFNLSVKDREALITIYGA